MGWFLRIYYAVLVLVSALTIFLTVKISNLSDEMYESNGIFTHRSIAHSSESTKNIVQGNSKVSSPSEIPRPSPEPENTEVTELDAAMHYIDFQKSNW